MISSAIAPHLIPLTPLHNSLSFADRGFYEDWVITSLFQKLFCSVTDTSWPLSHSGTRRPGTNSTASGTNLCTIFCYDTSTLQPSPRTNSRAPKPCSPLFSSLLPHTSSSWLWLPKRSGAFDPTSSLLPLPCVMLTMTMKHGHVGCTSLLCSLSRFR